MEDVGPFPCPRGTGPCPVRMCRAGGTRDGVRGRSFGQQQDTAVGPGCWMGRGGSELLPPQAPGSGEDLVSPSSNSHSFGCLNPPPQRGPSCLAPLQLLVSFTAQLSPHLNCAQQALTGGKPLWLNEQQQHPSSWGCQGCHSQICLTNSSFGIPPPTTQHHQQQNQQPQHSLEAALIGQAG